MQWFCNGGAISQIAWFLFAIAGLLALAPIPTESTICENVDVMWTLKKMRKLENCTIVKGYVKIAMIDYLNNPDAELDLFTFPKLRYLFEILCQKL